MEDRMEVKKKLWLKAVEPNVGQASSLSSPGEPSDGRQAGSLSHANVIEEIKGKRVRPE